MLADINRRGLVLLGCGKMGSAMLAGWLDRGVLPDAVHVIDPAPSAWLRDTGVTLSGDLPAAPVVTILAVKPQMMADALPSVTGFGPVTTVISVAAGTTLASLSADFADGTPIVRAMPNTPAAVGRGITAFVGNAAAGADALELADALLAAVGQTVRLDSEDQIDAVTAVSGSGPAYVFHLIETLAAAGAKEGLPPELAMALAKATVAGAGALAEVSDTPPADLRVNVTSPGGTTEAALEVLMDPSDGFPALLGRAVAAAAARARELGQ